MSHAIASPNNFAASPVDSQYFVRQRQRRDLWLARHLIYAYFFLLIFEGALRKWILPEYSNVLLIIRDPVLLALYFFTWRSGLFPRNIFIAVGSVIALSALIAGLVVLEGNAVVPLYGFRANFFHLPLIFVMARLLTLSDVRRIGYYTLLIAIPMAILMAVQFQSAPAAFINSGANDAFQQIGSAGGRIRPPGTFSFIAGPVYFFSFVAALLLNGSFVQNYPRWLVWGATLAVLLASVVSGSRFLVANIAIVFVVGFACSCVFKPVLALRWLGSLIVVGLVAFALSQISVVQDGVSIFTTRLTAASQSEGGAEGFAGRFLGDFLGALPLLSEAPFWGYGLGMGTNVGAVLVSGKAQIMLAEGEWQRVVLENGPLIGSAFVLFRVALTAWIGRCAIIHVARRDPLPVLLFGATALTVITGNFGQPTVLGFAVFVAGLCLAACRMPAPESTVSPNDSSQQPVSLAPPLQSV